MGKTTHKRKMAGNNTQKLILLSTALLLTLSVIFTYFVRRYTQEKVSDNNLLTATLMSDYLENAVSDMSMLKYAFSNNLSLVHTLKQILGSYEISYEERQAYSMVQTTLLAQMYTKPYVDSFYLYYTNDFQRFYVSDAAHNTSYVGELSSFSDTAWFESYRDAPDGMRIWSERRELRNPASDTLPSKSVISLYNCLYTVGAAKSTGVFVVNLNSDRLENALRDMAVPGQNIFVFNEQDQLCLSVCSGELSAVTAAESIAPQALPKELVIDSVRYNVYSAQPTESGWRLVMLIKASEQASLLWAPSFAVGGICLAAIILQYFGSAYLAKKKNLLVRDVMNVLESAEKGEQLPAAHQDKADTDGLVRETLINFIENRYYKTSWKEKQYHMQVLELLVLQNQMNPHFLFNTLHTINWKAISLTGGENDVSLMIENLSSILRYSLREPLHMVTLREEISVVECYIQIENLKNGNKFRPVEWLCGIAPERYRIPKLIIQPLVENCVLHAFPLKREDCRIRVRVFEDRGALVIRVIDNGVGIERETLDSLRRTLNHVGPEDTAAEHLGIINTKNRLQLLFGQKVRMHVSSLTGIGTAVQIAVCWEDEPVPGE